MKLSLNGPGFLRRAYTVKSLYQLFMACAFPIHVWAILMVFRDFSWVAQRTSAWDAVGLLSYATTFALVETIGVFVVVLLLGFLVSNAWGEDSRLALAGTLFLVVAFWAILGQTYLLLGYHPSKQVIDFLIQTNHPFRVLWGVLFPLVVLSAFAPVVFIFRSAKTKNLILELFDRISFLSSFYVFLDFVGIIVLAIRNIRA